MSTPLLAGLSSVLSRLESSLIEPGDDIDSFTPAHHDRALGYRVLAAAAIEQHVEQMSAKAAREGTDRLRKHQPTRTGRAILSWHCVRSGRLPIPVETTDFVADPDLLAPALDAFETSVRGTHGLSRQNAGKLIYPLGVGYDPQIEQLLDKLDELSNARNKAAHVWVNRTKQLQPPTSEANRVLEIIALLDHLHQVVAACVDGVP